MSCPNCGGVLWKRERKLIRDIDFCLTCGFTVETVGTGVAWATAVSAFIQEFASAAYADEEQKDQRQA